MYMRNQTGEGLKNSISETDLIPLGAARAMRIKEWKKYGNTLIAHPPAGIDRIFFMDEIVSQDGVARCVKVYHRPPNLNGCETYEPGMEIQPNTFYRLPDSIDRIIFKE